MKRKTVNPAAILWFTRFSSHYTKTRGGISHGFVNANHGTENKASFSQSLCAGAHESVKGVLGKGQNVCRQCQRGADRIRNEFDRAHTREQKEARDPAPQVPPADFLF